MSDILTKADAVANAIGRVADCGCGDIETHLRDVEDDYDLAYEPGEYPRDYPSDPLGE